MANRAIDRLEIFMIIYSKRDGIDAFLNNGRIKFVSGAFILFFSNL